MSTARVVNALKKRESSFRADLCAVVKSFMICVNIPCSLSNKIS